MDPRFAAADAAFQAKRDDEGMALLTAALSEGPGPIGAYRLLAVRLYNLHRYAESETWARKGLEQAPKNLDLWNLLGVVLRRQQKYAEALAALDKAQKLDPKSLMPLINKANVYNDMRDGQRALECAQKLTRQQPSAPEHHRTLATAYRHLGQLENAAARLEVAIRLQPKAIDAWLDRASIASNLQKHEEAAAVIERGLAANPGDQRLLETQSILLRRAGRRGESEAMLREMAARPDAPAWTHYQLGRTLADFNREEANGHFRRAVELAPDNRRYRFALIESLERSRYGDEGAHIQEGYEQLLEAVKLGAPPNAELYVARQTALRVGDYALLDRLGGFREFGRETARSGIHGPLLNQLGRVQAPEDRYEVLEQHRLWGKTVEEQVARIPPINRPPPRPKDGRIRLGLLSSDLRNHPVGYFALPLFQHLDRERFDVYCYSFYTGQEDNTQKYIASQVKAFRWNKSISDRDAAQMIADDQLDMLIELGGSTHMNKLEVMAYRAAPLQASWLGYPHSAGLSTIDYIVTDPYITPPDPRLLIEKPMVMPHTWLCLGQLQFRDNHEINPVTPEERNGFVTFGTANNPHKYSPHMLRTWAKVLAATPGSRFLWVRPESGVKSFREHMLAIFAEEGIGPERVRFEAVRGAHMPFYNDIDIALDTFPLTGGTTTCETLWMGVPVVSMVGEALFERLSYSILSNAGLGDLVSANVEDYVATAVKLAADPARRMTLRATLRDQLKASPLYAHQQFAKDFYELVARDRHGDMSPDAAESVWIERATGRAASGDLPGAARLAGEGVAERPESPALWNLYGGLLAAVGLSAQAVDALERAARLAPAEPEPLRNLAALRLAAEDWSAASDFAGRLLRVAPRDAEAHRMLGRALAGLGRTPSAEARLRLALSFDPGLVQAWLDLAYTLNRSERPAEALASVEAGLTANPGDGELLEMRAVLLRRAGRPAEAEAMLREMAARPDAPAWTHYQLGRTLADFNREEANGHFRRAVELAPGNGGYRFALIESLERSRHGDEGAHIQEGYEQLLTALQRQFTPSGLDLHIARQTALRVGDYALLDRLGGFREFGRETARSGIHGPLLNQLGRVQAPEDRYEVLEQHRLWGKIVEEQVARIPPITRPPPRPKDGRVRLGLLSSDLRNHPVGYFALPLFQHLDRERFDVYCYSFYTGQEDNTQKYIASQVKAFRWNKSISDRDAAQMIADDQLDMLIELGGSTHMNKLEVMAYRAAPLQASWLGYPHSAGLSTIDYIVTDPYITPPDPRLLIEKPMVMPHTWLCLGQLQFRDNHEINPVTPEERNGFVTFGTANNPHKYSPHMLRTWAKVLAATPGSRFLWVRPESGVKSFREHMLAIFAEEGIGPERVRFEAVRGAHMPFYNDIDIALDTFPLTGGTTTCETLWMGVPVVSMVGEALFERLSYSILSNAGLGDLVSANVEDYVATAVKLAADPARRMTLRATLRDQLKASPLYAHQQFAKDFYELVAETVRQRA